MTFVSRYVISVWLLCCLTNCQDLYTPVVEISQGKLRGLRTIAGSFHYYGIPYASAERYQLPREPPIFDGVFDAVLCFRYCAQYNELSKSIIEDCLVLDVYTPDSVTTTTKLPVMMFIHGGGYFTGTRDLYNADRLASENIIVLTINYRLSALGFLCLNGVANLGLKDQLAALKWIKKNIATFGGDPDNVTLMGQSAGANSVGMHIVSKQSKGLFHKAILLSGSPVTPWAINVDPIRPAIRDSRKISKMNTFKDIYKSFAKSSVIELTMATEDHLESTRYFKYTPCVDSNLTDPFLHDTPYNIIKSGNFNKVPVIVGITNMEGIVFYGCNEYITYQDWHDNFINKLPSVFSWCSQEDRLMIAKKIRDHYIDRRRLDKGVVSFYSDWASHATFDAFSRLLIKYSDQPVYNYVFSYKGDRNFFNYIYSRGLKFDGATHGDEIMYIFNLSQLLLILTNSDKVITDRLTRMIKKFMKFSNPTPHTTRLLPAIWPPSTANTSHIMHIDRTLQVHSRSWPKPGFFLNMLCTYGQQGYVPCESAQQCNKGPATA